MVSYLQIELERDKRYRVTKQESFVGSDDRYLRTIRNLNSMLRDGRPLSIIVPSRPLSIEELEEYRVFFCKEAKRVRRNLVYFEAPVKVELMENEGSV